MSIAAQDKPETLLLPAGHALTVIADSQSSGRVWTFTERLAEATNPAEVAPYATVMIGPFATTTHQHVECLVGALTYGAAPVDFPTLEETVEWWVNQSPLYVVPVRGTYHPGMAELFGAGAPASSVRAYAQIDPTGAENTLVFTATSYGSEGNSISIEYVAPAANNAALSVAVAFGDTLAITVNLATDAEGAITSTASDIVTAIEGSDAASFVTVEIGGGDGGADDGSGVVTAYGPESLADGAGVGVFTAAKGSRYTDTTTPALYLNTGTDAQPVWARVLTTDDL